MQETYKNLKGIAALVPTKLTEDMIEEYKITKDDVTLAKVFVQYYPHFLNVSSKYYYLTDEDKASYILEEIAKALIAYDKTKGASIQTLATKYINNRLRAETQSAGYQLRKANNTSESYEELMEINAVPESSISDYSEMELIDYIDSLSFLNKNEKIFCKIHLLDRTGELADKIKDKVVISTTKVLDTEIAQLMGISGASVAYIKKCLAKKLTPEILLTLNY